MPIRSVLRPVFGLFPLLLSAPHVFGQQPSQATPTIGTQPLYDVVSIRENKPASDGKSITSIRNVGASFTATNVSLTVLVMNAYGLRPELISRLPGWADSTHFDIKAKVSDPDMAAMKDLPREQRRAMLVALLADRFHLKAHIEVKTLPVYDLVIAKGGSKLTENKTVPDPDSPGIGPHKLRPGSMWINNSGSSTEMNAVGIPASGLAANLAFQVQRNVIDKTGLTGKYDLTLKFVNPELEAKADAATDNNAPDLFTALQEQLGLKLESSKGPVDTLVVDHVEMPTEN